SAPSAATASQRSRRGSRQVGADEPQRESRPPRDAERSPLVRALQERAPQGRPLPRLRESGSLRSAAWIQPCASAVRPGVPGWSLPGPSTSGMVEAVADGPHGGAVGDALIDPHAAPVGGSLLNLSDEALDDLERAGLL